jgi:hypothetical protein
MLDTFKARLKAKSTAAGVNNLSSKRIDAEAAKLDKLFPDLTEEKDHDEKIDLLFQADDFKKIGAFDDWERTKAAREAKDKADKDKKTPATQIDTDPKEDEDDVKTMLKTLLQKVNTLESEKTQQTFKQKAADLLKDIPEKFWNKRPIPESEEALTAFAEEVKADYTELVQESSEKGLTVLSTRVPASSGSDLKDKTVSPEIKAYAEKTKATAATK